MKIITKVLLAATALAAVSPAYATTYLVNQTVGGFAVTGQIVTDGTVGQLSRTNISSYSFTFQGQTSSGNISQITALGSNLVASATSLTYNFSNTNSGYFYFGLGNGSYYCLQNNGCYDFTGAGIGIRALSSASSRQAGIVTIATAAAAGAVPETATWGMMIAGFGMMGAAMRTRRRRTTVSFA